MSSETAVRRLASRRYHRVTKSRDRSQLHFNNAGQWMLVDDRNCVVLGVHYDATLEQIDLYLRRLPLRKIKISKTAWEEWRTAYQAAHAGTLAPSPEVAWACEQLLGGHTPAIVLRAIREHGDPHVRCGDAWDQVLDLAADLIRTLARKGKGDADGDARRPSS